MKKIFLIYVLTHCMSSLHSQDGLDENYPVINQKCPGFTLNDVQYYSKKQVSLKDFGNKPFILDFFSLGCTSCFVSFPKVNELISKFGNGMQFILVGQDSKKTGALLRKSYERYRTKYNLNIPVAYDSIIFEQFKISSVPHMIWVDKDRVVTAVTSSQALTKENIEAFLEGKKFDFEDFSYSARRASKLTPELKFDLLKPFLIDGNGGNDTNFVQRSILAIWKNGMPAKTAFSVLSNYEKYKIIPLQILGWPLPNLYRAAYFGMLSDWFSNETDYYGKCAYSPILELKDSSLFQFEWAKDQNKFSYSQILPEGKRTLKNMMEVMQRDLQNYFGFEASVETRKMPYLKLVATQEAKKKLATKGGEQIWDFSYGGIDFVNVPMKDMIHCISYSASLVSNDLPLIDETGISSNIDIKFDAAMTDWQDVKMSLLKLGLNIVQSEKEMKVIVIRDPKN